MKSLIKFFPVAVGVLALASCSNDDFFGSSSEDGKLELVATVAAPVGSDDGLITRSVISPAENVADYSTSWDSKDKFRVYDAALQKYDAFSYKAESKKITIDTESPKVTEYAKAIFPAASVSYAGWSADNDAVTATVKIEDQITYEPAVKVGEKTAYVSNLPMWGNATMEDDHLAVNLNPLTAYVDFTVYGGAAKRIRVISAKQTSLNPAGTTTLDDFKKEDVSAYYPTKKAPLTGYFDALLKTDYTDSYLVADFTAPLQDQYGYKINVIMGTNAADEAHVFIPIVPQTYDFLIIQTSPDATGDTWETKKEYKSQAVGNNIVLRKGLEIGDAIETQDAKISKFGDIDTRLTTFNNGSYVGVKVINIDLADGVAADAIKTSADKKTITIPNYNEEKIINLNFDIDDTGFALKIKNENTKATVLNLKTIKGSSAVTIDQGTLSGDNAFVITGEINSTGTGESKRLTIDNTGNLRLGLGSFGPFKSDMNLYLTKNVNKLYIDAAEGNTIPAIDASADDNASDINIESGTVTAIGGTIAAKTPVTVDGGTVTTLKTTTGAITVKNGSVGTATTGDAAVDIQGGTVNKVTNKNGKVTVAADATVGEITTASTSTENAINANVNKVTMTGAGTLTITDATVGELNVNVTAATINLAGTTKLAQITSLKTNKTEGTSATVSSTGEAAILAVSADARFSFTSKWDGKKAAIGSDNKIYTAAQLASATTGKAYTLLTDVTAFNQAWTPVNISKDFDGNSKTLTGLNAPLFGTISGGTVKKLNLATVNINTDAANQGALAQTVSGTTTINEIAVTSGTIGKADGKATTKNIGGLIGTANGTVTLDKNQVTANVQGYANVGGFIGNVAGGSVTFKANEAEASNVTFKQTFEAATTIDMNEGTFGNFIGSITGEGANVTIGGADKLGANFAAFFGANDAVKTALDASVISFAKNKVGDPAKTYQGMKTAIVDRTLTYEIGYSPVQAVGTVILYGTITDELGNDIKVKINHINQYN